VARPLPLLVAAGGRGVLQAGGVGRSDGARPAPRHVWGEGARVCLRLYGLYLSRCSKPGRRGAAVSSDAGRRWTLAAVIDNGERQLRVIARY
jgi:hypothetical protein